MVIGISFMLYLGGFTSPFLGAVETLGQDNTIYGAGTLSSALFSGMWELLTDPTFLVTLAVAGISSVATGGGYGTTAYLGAVVIYTFALNYFILPISFLFESSAILPAPISTIVFVILNAFSLLAFLSFIREGSV